MMKYEIKSRLARAFFSVGWIMLPMAFIFMSLFIGRYPMSLSEVCSALWGALPFNIQSAGTEITSVILRLRLPRGIAAAFVGAGLAASGTAFQGVFRNPLVNSGILGVSAGAGFGAALAILMFSNYYLIYVFAFIFGVSAVGLSYWAARIYKTAPAVTLILGGIVVSSMFSALLSLIKYIADVNNELPAIIYWLMGSVASVEYRDFWALIPIGAGVTLLCLYSWRINVLSIGEREAKAMGLDVGIDKRAVIISATLATAGAVCISGTIGWVGLVIPHISRMLTGSDNRILMPVSVSMGASFMVLIDCVSRSLTTSEIPLGILTGIIGAPFFIFLLKKTKGGGFGP
jgi:iron complex transport system permease protein